MARNQSEAALYPLVERWLHRSQGCFAQVSNAGTRAGRIDVVGLKDVGGDLSGRVDVIAVEVKLANWPFVNAAGQAKGYSVYADYAYLAMQRPDKPYTDEERLIASRLGVGLIMIGKKNRITEVLSPALNEPLEGQRLQIIDKVGYAVCTICGTTFQKGDTASSMNKLVRFDGVRPGAMRRAHEKERGIVYWLETAAERDAKRRDLVYWRRYICPDCIAVLVGDSIEEDG